VETDGVALFSERAAGRDPSFRETPAVAELCRRLDHLPLAIELAAARTTVFSPEQLLERLAERLDLFKGARDADPRQQTLRTTIEWSFNLLAEEEQRLFRRLSVFAGGCTYQAAEQVCEASPDALQSLVDKSLVRRRVVDVPEPRFWMLETIRQYASEQLEASGEQVAVVERHGSFYARLSRDAEQGLRASERFEWVRRLDLERENLALSIARSLAEGHVARALEIASSLWDFWEARGPNEGRDWLNRAIDAAGGQAPAKAHYALGHLVFFQGDYDGAAASLRTAADLARAEGDMETLVLALGVSSWVLAEREERDRAVAIASECLESARSLEDPWLRAEAANYAGSALTQIGDLEASRPLLEESLRLRRLHGGEEAVADSLLNLGYNALAERRLGEATRLLEESIAISRAQHDDFRLALALGNLGTVGLLQGRISDAKRVLIECLRLCAERGDNRVGAESLLVLAATIADEGDAARAIRFAETARTLYTAIGISPLATISGATTARLERARVQLGEIQAVEAEAAGRDLTLEQVVLDLQESEATGAVD
jgi:tetratricopeptide (TPR) repeat protein